MDFTLCAWRVRSVLPLPETAPWDGSDRPVDIEIHRGAIPTQDGQSTTNLPYQTLLTDGSLIFDAMPYARFLVTASRVVVDLPNGSQVPDWRAFLLGPVLALLCYLRGLLPLHASAVRIGGRAVAFAGRSGAGKSTLAAALYDRGYALVTDDICPVDSLSTIPVVRPTFPGMKLSTTTLAALRSEKCDLVPVQPVGDKMQVPRTSAFDPTPLPLDLLYVIQDSPDDRDDRVATVSGAEAFEQLSVEIYRPEIGRFLFQRSALFSMAAQLSAHIAVRRLIRRQDYSRLSALARLVESDAMRAPSPKRCPAPGHTPHLTAN